MFPYENFWFIKNANRFKKTIYCNAFKKTYYKSIFRLIGFALVLELSFQSLSKSSQINQGWWETTSLHRWKWVWLYANLLRAKGTTPNCKTRCSSLFSMWERRKKGKQKSHEPWKTSVVLRCGVKSKREIKETGVGCKFMETNVPF